MAAICEIFSMTTHTTDTIVPNLYWKAANEIIFGTVLASFAISSAATPEVFDSNQVKTMLGYNSWQVAWETTPALYIAPFLMFPVSFCVMQMVQLDSKRAYMLQGVPNIGRLALRVVNFLVMISMGIMIVSLVFPRGVSMDEMKARTWCMIQLAPILSARLIMDLYIEKQSGSVLGPFVTAVAAICCIVALTFFGLASYSLVAWKEGMEPVVNPTLMMVLDYAWLVSLPLGAAVLPEGQPMHVAYSEVVKEVSGQRDLQAA